MAIGSTSVNGTEQQYSFSQSSWRDEFLGYLKIMAGSNKKPFFACFLPSDQYTKNADLIRLVVFDTSLYYPTVPTTPAATNDSFRIY